MAAFNLHLLAGEAPSPLAGPGEVRRGGGGGGSPVKGTEGTKREKEGWGESQGRGNTKVGRSETVKKRKTFRQSLNNTM